MRVRIAALSQELGMQLKLSDICTTAGTQIRSNVSNEKVIEYANLLNDGTVFDPVQVVDDGQTYILWDGFHRFSAHAKAGRETIQAEVTKGTVRDAILLAVGANSRHGLPRTQADRRNAVNRMLDDVEWTTWSDRAIAKACDVSHSLVSTVRKERLAKVAKTPPAPKVELMPPKVEETPPEYDEREEALKDLASENEQLRGKLALAALPEEQREEAASYLEELKEENQSLRQQLDAVTLSRDQYMAENAQLKKQVAMLQRKLKT